MLVGCGHKPPPPTKNPEPSPVPKGDLLRFKANAGDEPKAKVTLLIEQEQAAKTNDKNSQARKVVLSFRLVEEEKVDAIAPDGTAQLSSRLVDAVGEAGTGAPQNVVDEFALVLDELKVQFRRSPRGDVSSITVAGVRNPVDDKTARAILNAIFAGGRGPILPEEFVDVGATWNNTAQVPTNWGTSAEATYVYKYVSRDNGIATISCEGSLDSQKAGSTAQKRMTNKNTAELKFDIAKGRLIGLVSDGTTQIEDVVQGTAGGVGGGIKSHVKVTWAAVQ
jgi:hypothetical protein